jgi:uncharacterized membrane-anchored protein
MRRLKIMLRHRKKILITLIIIQILFLIGLATSYYAISWFGKEIRIQTEPVDPRDLLYGDYVILNYDISELSTSLWKGSGESPESGSRVYVVMQPKSSEADAVYDAAAVYGTKPSVTDDQVILRGRVDYSYDRRIGISYGIEKYYVPENTGKELEDYVGDMTVRISSAPWGQAVIEKLELLE